MGLLYKGDHVFLSAKLKCRNPFFFFLLAISTAKQQVTSRVCCLILGIKRFVHQAVTSWQRGVWRVITHCMPDTFPCCLLNFLSISLLCLCLPTSWLSLACFTPGCVCLTWHLFLLLLLTYFYTPLFFLSFFFKKNLTAVLPLQPSLCCVSCDSVAFHLLFTKLKAW